MPVSLPSKPPIKNCQVKIRLLLFGAFKEITIFSLLVDGVQKLLLWREQLVKEYARISDLLKEKSLREPERALGADKALKPRTCNRYIKLIYKINNELERIKDGTYGYCEETGKEIGIKRLEARPIATLSIEARERYEQMKRITQAGH